ncbi:formyltransferase family protein [Mucilaginibacter panaciglaebae]|uniref:Formyl transferase N-terminal domain-containing protein n=1 Tax=Mucilaginibacter panaciglaebae TaxID=502331 RepID=A0ABP7WE77_9SPHI
MYNAIYLGSSAEACDYIHCHDNFNVIAVVCEKKMVNSDLLTCCFLRGIPLVEIEVYEDLLQAFEERKGSFELAIMYIFGIIMRQSILQNHKIYNIHMGYLPHYKGRNSTFFATIKGEKSIGISLHEVIPKIDEGRIIARRKVPYYFWMGETELRGRLICEILPLLDQLSLFLCDPDFKYIENNHAHYYAPITDDMINISVDMPVNMILNIIRTQQAYRGARFIHESQSFFVNSAKVERWDNIGAQYIKEETGVVLSAGKITGIAINEQYCLLFTDIHC